MWQFLVLYFWNYCYYLLFQQQINSRWLLLLRKQPWVLSAMQHAQGQHTYHFMLGRNQTVNRSAGTCRQALYMSVSKMCCSIKVNISNWSSTCLFTCMINNSMQFTLHIDWTSISLPCYAVLIRIVITLGWQCTPIYSSDNERCGTWYMIWCSTRYFHHFTET